MRKLSQIGTLLGILFLLIGCGDSDPQVIKAEPVLELMTPPVFISDDTLFLQWDTRKTFAPDGGVIISKTISENFIGFERIKDFFIQSYTKRDVAQLVGTQQTVTLDVHILVSTAIGVPGVASQTATVTFFVDRTNFNEFGVIISDVNGVKRFLLW